MKFYSIIIIFFDVYFLKKKIEKIRLIPTTLKKEWRQQTSNYDAMSPPVNFLFSFVVTYYFYAMLWHGNECGENKSNENFKTAIRSNNYDRSKTFGECGMF